MMKKFISLTIVFISIMTMAQETYESAQIATVDLNGTARYVGMGGAMEALGADISTMSTNPAGIGLFRRPWIGVSAGATIQNGDNTNVQILNKSGITNADLNQIGAIYSMQTAPKSFLNFGFNFQKSRNFNQILSAYQEYDEGQGVSLSKSTAITGYSYTENDMYIPVTHQLVFDTFNNFIPRTENESEPDVNKKYSGYPYANSDKYLAQREISGYIGNFDFNISGNIKNRIFLGITFGIKNVNYSSDSYYKENLLSANYIEPNYYTAPIKHNNANELGIRDNRSITGTGFDIKFGAIFRPIEESPFRIGLYINTPTWYKLTCSSTMYAYGVGDYETVKYKMVDNTPVVQSSTMYSFNSDNSEVPNTYDYRYDYKINTPWRFGFSVGHTFGTQVAIGATYEFADYSAITNKVRDGYYYDYYDRYHDNYNSDKDMDQNTKESLKGVHTLKLGAEIKPVPEVAIRMGYNYVSPIYEEGGYKCLNMYSPGYEYCMADYTNWKGVNRITFGLGFLLGKNVNLDLAYQYATQKGTYHPYCDYTLITDNNRYDITAPTTEVKNNRHQINCTLSYKF